jgi:hypothetical protein
MRVVRSTSIKLCYQLKVFELMQACDLCILQQYDSLVMWKKSVPRLPWERDALAIARLCALAASISAYFYNTLSSEQSQSHHFHDGEGQSQPCSTAAYYERDQWFDEHHARRQKTTIAAWREDENAHFKAKAKTW